MLAGRPHEAVSNGSPRWMAVGPRSRGCTEPGLQAGSPAAYAPELAPSGAQRSAGSQVGGRIHYLLDVLPVTVLPVEVRSWSGRRCCGGRDDAKLLHHPESVHDDPALGYLAVCEPVDGPRSHGDVLSGRGYAQERTSVGTLPDRPAPDPVF